MSGAEAVVNSPADGYTFPFTTAALAINATLSRNTIKFDPVKDLAPAIWTRSTPLVLIVHPNVAAKSAAELEVRARFEQDALIAAGGTPEDLGAHLKRETDRYAEVIRKGHIAAQ